MKTGVVDPKDMGKITVESFGLGSLDKAPARDGKVESFMLKPFANQSETKEEKASVHGFKLRAFSSANLTLKEAEALKAEAESMLAQARQTLENAQAEAEKESAEIKETARKEGHEQGLAQGLEEGRAKGLAQGQKNARQEFKSSLAKTIESLKAIDQYASQLDKNNEAMLVKLAGLIAGRVCCHEINTSAEIISSLFTTALAKLHEMHEAEIRLHPQDLEVIQSSDEDLRAGINGLVKITLAADETLNRGDIVIQTEAGKIDGTLKRRLEAVIGVVDEKLKEDFTDLDW